MEYRFSGPIWYWRGPVPHHFVTVPADVSAELKAQEAVLSYGWGCIPVVVRIGKTRFTTALIPRGDTYALPVKVAVRRYEKLDVDDLADVTMTVGETVD